MPKNLIWKRLQCAHILSLIMNFHTRIVHCGAIPNVHVSIFLTKKQIISIQKQHPQYGFTFNTSMDVDYVTCVKNNLHQITLKIYTRKELVMMETTIYNFQTSFYIPSIQNLAFHLPHVSILDTNHFGAMKSTTFKKYVSF